MLNTYLKKSKNRLYKNVDKLIFDSNLTIGNMEFVTSNSLINDDCGIGYKEKVTPPKHFTKNLQVILLFHKNSKFSGVNLSNNHIMDNGELSIKQTIDYLNKNGIKPIGVDRIPENRITYFQIGKIKIAIVAFNFWSNYENSTASEWSNIIESVNEKKIKQVDLDKIKEQIDICKNQKPTRIILSLHFGLEFELYTRIHLKHNVYRILELLPEIDLVWGHHPHVIQPYEVFKVKEKKIPIFFSIGNLTHPFSALQCTISNVLKINLDSRGEIISIDINPVIQSLNKDDFIELKELNYNKEQEINKILFE